MANNLTPQMIFDNHSWISSGPRILMRTRRSKEGGKGNPDRHALKRVVEGEEQIVKQLGEMISTADEGERIYISVNARDMERGIRNFKERQLDADYDPAEVRNSFYKDIHNRWISSLAKRNAKATSFFLFDVDYNEGNDYQELLKQLKDIYDVTIIDDYETKNGRHIITTPFNYPKLVPEFKELVNPDGMCLLYW